MQVAELASVRPDRRRSAPPRASRRLLRAAVGEVDEYAEVLEDSRRHAVDRMTANAHVLGADTIIAVRFDSSEMGKGLTEILAYGTAVKLAQ